MWLMYRNIHKNTFPNSFFYWVPEINFGEQSLNNIFFLNRKKQNIWIV